MLMLLKLRWACRFLVAPHLFLITVVIPLSSMKYSPASFSYLTFCNSSYRLLALSLNEAVNLFQVGCPKYWRNFNYLNRRHNCHTVESRFGVADRFFKKKSQEKTESSQEKLNNSPGTQ
jgi:hypothetical protein